MDFVALSTRMQIKAAESFDSLTPDDFYNIWLAGGVVLLLFVVWLSHRIMRKAFGHVQFRWTWYTEDQWETMIKMIDEDSKPGYRVMQHDAA
ncbi:MAG: hypothetical protein Q8O52_16565 [Sulfuritalea sp.]|nr:hypothetical protein [Sulfuritalea sp.]